MNPYLIAAGLVLTLIGVAKKPPENEVKKTLQKRKKGSIKKPTDAKIVPTKETPVDELENTSGNPDTGNDSSIVNLDKTEPEPE